MGSGSLWPLGPSGSLGSQEPLKLRTFQTLKVFSTRRRRPRAVGCDGQFTHTRTKMAPRASWTPSTPRIPSPPGSPRPLTPPRPLYPWDSPGPCGPFPLHGEVLQPPAPRCTHPVHGSEGRRMGVYWRALCSEQCVYIPAWNIPTGPCLTLHSPTGAAAPSVCTIA